MTLSKLARLANVSVSVVSKAFSGKEGVSDAMREHVFAVAREHGCFQQFYHAPYDKPVIAVIIPEAISGFYIRYIEVLKKSMEENRCTMLLSISNFDRQLADELVRYYTEHSKVDGLLLVGAADTLPQNTTTAIVSVGGEIEIGACIRRDLKSGFRRCLEYLRETGHTDVGYVGEPLTESKRDCLVECMREMGFAVCPEWMITSLSRFDEAGRDGVRRILSCQERPTVIIGAYSYITQGILSELRENGISVPEGMSVISMDSDPRPLDTALDVTCLVSGIEEICDVALGVLRERMQTDRPNDPCVINLETELHRGKSVQRLS